MKIDKSKCIVCKSISTVEGFYYPSEKKNWEIKSSPMWGDHVEYGCCDEHVGIDKRPYFKK